MRLGSALFAFCSVVFVFSMFSILFLPSLSRNKYAPRMQREVLDEMQASFIEYNLSNFDDELVSKAIQPGNPDRLKNVLRKALRGENITVVVLGGSNSAGGYLGADEKSLDGIYFKIFTSWWNNYIAKRAKAFVKELQLAIGDTGSYFYAYCYKTFIEEDKEIDIVLIEVSINDKTMVEPLEQLTRQVLMHPSAPALLYINLVSRLNSGNPSCMNLERLGQTNLAGHYGITSLSLREILCREEKGKWRAVIKNTTASDGNHIDVNAHALVGMTMIKYVRSVFKELINDVNRGVDKVGDNGTNLPKLLFIKHETKALRQPLCWTGKTPDVSKSLHHPNLQLNIIDNKGFSWCLELKNKTKPLRSDGVGGWCARERFSNLKLRIFVPELTVKDLSFRSRSVSVMVIARGGNAAVWLDNKESKAVHFYKKHAQTYDTIATRVSPGYHNLTVRTLREGMFVVSGVFVGPPDFHLRSA